MSETSSQIPSGLMNEIEQFVVISEHNYLFNSRADTLITLTSIALSLGVVVAGVYKRIELATILGALVTSTVTAQRAFPFNQRWQFYRTLWCQAQNLATKVRADAITPDEALAVLSSLRLDFAQQVPRGRGSASDGRSDDHSDSELPSISAQVKSD